MKNLFIKTSLLILASLIALPASAQVQRKGKWYGAYGWNRSSYQDSTIHFHGKGHNFTLYKTTASDAQTPVNVQRISSRYLSPLNSTIPQYNWRFGYFFTNNFALSFGWDHMKYVVNPNQTVKMTGHIDASMSPKYAFSGTKNQKLSSDFLTYEHTDGFNNLTLDGEWFKSIYNPSKGFDISLVGGVGGGVVIPKTNVHLTGHARNDQWHLAGVSANIKAGVELTGWHNFFFRMMIKQGYANMYDVLTTKEGDKASQTIVYTEAVGMFGYRF